MTSNAEWKGRAETALLRNYAPAPVAFVKGEGSRLWDADGNEYLDFCAGVAVCSTGHAHPKVVAAVQEQAARLGHVSNLYLIPQQVELAERLAALSGLTGGSFFCNSGTEAVEAAMKLAKVWGRAHGGRSEIVAATNSFHGRTLGALTATGQEKYRKPFHPLLPGVTHVPYGDAEAMAAAVTDSTCAVLVEPVQGEGGVRVPPADYLRALRDLCDDRELLLLLDEVQTGIGRTGEWFAYEHAGVRPDVVALAKGLGSGFPVGAIVASERAAVFEPGQHASTFGGNPLASAAALATLDVIETEDVLENVRTQGGRLRAALAEVGGATDVRGLGLLVAFDLADQKASETGRALLSSGLLVSTIGDRTIRLAPPLTVSGSDVEAAVERIASVLGGASVESSASGPA